MKDFDYEAVTYDGAVYCIECLPDGVDEEDTHPIFAGSEWSGSPPKCDVCGYEHDYMSIIETDES